MKMMIIVPIQDVSFDDKATLAMGAAFDQACSSLGKLARAEEVRELLAKRIIDAARNGELDPVRLHSQALSGFSIEDVSMPVVSVGPMPPASPTLRLRTLRNPESPAGSPRLGSSPFHS
jgi:hypothetical protein